ncbi:MAG TPA: ABC transporter ATP-binding protein [Usitatibacter sp.]|jgi:putative spermidine/putrescine transport system ATP-binding protein|nr:ABC transporter ATP-binding protein [Usitatibacter sp.]
MAVAIHLRDCAKTFPDATRALEPLSIDITAGETVVLLGPSGCGKTTTLRIIAGLESPDAGGRVLFDRDDVTALPIEKRGVGMVFQSYALFPNMTVAQNVGYGLRVRGMDAAGRQKRVAEMLELVDLGTFGARGIDQLSGGQRQRVALARALAIRPRVLLLDEPLTALDAKLREQLRVEIDRLLRSLGITAVYVTHDQAEAMALGDRIVVMEKGRIAQAGTPQEIYHRPATAFVAEFIGTMNRISGELVDGHLVSSAGRLPLGSIAARDVMFRPEDVRIVSRGEHHLEATVISSFFLGDHTRLVVDAGGASPLIVETIERRTWPRGERVHLAVEPGAILAVPAQMP